MMGLLRVLLKELLGKSHRIQGNFATIHTDNSTDTCTKPNYVEKIYFRVHLILLKLCDKKQDMSSHFGLSYFISDEEIFRNFSTLVKMKFKDGNRMKEQIGDHGILNEHIVECTL